MKNDVRTELIRLVASHRRNCGSPISNISPQRLASQLAAFKAGTLRDFALTADAIEERDDTLAGVIPKAKAAVARHGFEVCILEKIPDGMEQEAQRQKEALDYYYNNLRVTSAMEPDELGGFSLLVRQIMGAKGTRYGNHHIIWQPSRSGDYTATMIHVPLWFFENRTGPMRFIRTPHGYDGEDMEPGAWLTSVGDGVMRACAAAWLFKRGGLHAWVNYCEKHGFPIVLGKTPATEGSPEWLAMAEAVESIGEDWAGVVSQSAAIELIEAKGGAAIPYPQLVDRMDRALTRLWRGNDLGTMSREGAAVGANPQESETGQFDLDAAVWITETLQLKIDRLVINYVSGEDMPALAYVKIKGAPKKETELDLKVDAFLLAAGHPISKKQAAERYSRPLPAADDTDLLTKPAAPAGSPTVADAAYERALNEAVRSAVNDTAFAGRSMRSIVAAKVKAFGPLIARIERLVESDDPEAIRAELLRVQNDLPLYARACGITEAEVRAWIEPIGTKLLSGAVEAAKAKAAAA